MGNKRRILICSCGHKKKLHESGPCWGCLELNLKDNMAGITVNDRHIMCIRFKLDNLRYLEELSDIK